MSSMPKKLTDSSFMKDWEIVKEIGHGSNGIVYSIRNKETGRHEALKWIHYTSLTQIDMSKDSLTKYHNQVLNEILTQKELSACDNVVQINDYRDFYDGDNNLLDVLIRMELLESLPEHIQNHELTVGDVVVLMKDICTALLFCHQRGIVHGDIKPENLMVTPGTAELSFKLGDFGAVTVENQIVSQRECTRLYQLPEYRDLNRNTTDGDLYALGLVAYRLLQRGRFPGQEQYGSAAEQDSLEVRRLWYQKGFSDLKQPEFGNAQLKQLVCRAANPVPSQRYQSAQDLLDDIDQILQLMTITEKNQSVVLVESNNGSGYGKSPQLLLSTRHKTDVFPGEDKKRATAMHAHPLDRRGGFELPKQDTSEQKKPEQPAKNQPGERQESKEKKKSIWIIDAIAVAVLVLIIFTVKLLISIHNDYTLEAVYQSGCFELDLTDISLPLTEWNCSLATTVNDQIVTIDALPIHVDNLIPGKQYTLVAQKKEQTLYTMLETQPAGKASGYFTGQVYEVPASRITTEADALALAQRISATGSVSSVTETDHLSQTVICDDYRDYLMVCHMQFDELPSASELRVVVRYPNDLSWVWNEGSIESTSCSCLIALPLKHYLQRNNVEMNERDVISFDVYWGDSLVISQKLTMQK